MTQAKPFDPTKPTRTRSGLPVEILPRRVKSLSYPLIGVIIHPSDVETVIQFCADGKFSPNGVEHEYDLENIPERKVLWTNIYRDPESDFVTGTLTEKQITNPLRVASLEIHFEGETPVEVKIHPNFEQILHDKIPF